MHEFTGLHQHQYNTKETLLSCCSETSRDSSAGSTGSHIYPADCWEGWDPRALLTSNAEQRVVFLSTKGPLCKQNWSKISSCVGHQVADCTLGWSSPSLAWSPHLYSQVLARGGVSSFLSSLGSTPHFWSVESTHPYRLPGPYWALPMCKSLYYSCHKPLAQHILANYLPDMTQSSLAISPPDLSWRESTISDNMVRCRQMAS